MTSEFQKLICRELGNNNYNRYADLIRDGMKEKRVDLKMIFRDIYRMLEEKDVKDIAGRHDRLNDSLMAAFRISKMYLFSLLFYAAAIILLLVLQLNPLLTGIAIGGATLAFVWKTCEYIVNKYCYIDAQIVLIYKAVLERLILYKGTGKGSFVQK